MAREIGKMLNGQEPKVVNGPEIMSKYVGESEENVRKLFEDAEAEQAARGENSKLHIIIFDEIDAICKERGSTGGGTGVADSVVNQLLSKIDGVDALNNVGLQTSAFPSPREGVCAPIHSRVWRLARQVFLIGMTNRLDMIDEALLRPGRFELKLQIGLPDESGRLEIFNIHTKRLQDNKYLDSGVSLPGLAAKAKNFSGAEIRGLVNAAVSYATNRCMKDGSPTDIDMAKIENLKVSSEDFEASFNDIKPAFGADDEQFESGVDDIIEFEMNIDMVIQTGRLLAQQVCGTWCQPSAGFESCGVFQARSKF